MRAMPPAWKPTLGTAVIRGHLRALDRAEARAFRAYANGDREQRAQATSLLKEIIVARRDLIGAN